MAQSLHLQYLPFPFTTHSPVITWSHLWQRPLSEMISCFMRNINCSPTVVSISTSLPTEIGGPSTRGHLFSPPMILWLWRYFKFTIEYSLYHSQTIMFYQLMKLIMYNVCNWTDWFKKDKRQKFKIFINIFQTLLF